MGANSDGGVEITRFMRLASLWFAIVVAPLAAGCNDPSPPAASASPTAPSPASSAASLVVESFQVTLWPGRPTPSGVYLYQPHVVLREVQGRSAARLEALTFDLPTAPTARVVVGGDGCLITPEAKVVNAGGSWNIERAYLYCLELDSTTSLAGKTLKMTVSFSDEDGVRGMIDSTTTVSQ